MSNLIQVNPQRLCGGYARLDNNYVFQKSNNPLEFDTGNTFLKEKCDLHFNTSLTLYLILYEDGKIVYEKYRNPLSKSIPAFTWSITKSLVSWLFGYVFKDVDQEIKMHSNVFKNQPFGNLKIEHFLKMSSGLELEDEKIKNKTLLLLKDNIFSNEELLKLNFKKHNEPGKVFRYSNTDTEMLVHLLNQKCSFFDLFYSKIILPSRLKNNCYWLHDKNKNPIGSAGFSSSARDLLRLAIRFSEEMNSNLYFKNMISPLIENKPPKTDGISFDYYGYQTWYLPNSIWWIGKGGQRVGIDRKSNKILVSFGLSELKISNIYKIFFDFQKGKL